MRELRPSIPSDGPDIAGPLRFARFAYPPNSLGYCGPPNHRELLERTAAGAVDPGMRQLAQGFDGAWPYLDLIARTLHLDPLAPEVVDAYWIGSPALDRVSTNDLGMSLDGRFRRLAGPQWRHLEAGIPAGGVPHHSFHVFCVYPWVGLLRSGRTDHPLHVLDQCRIRSGTVIDVTGGTAVVETQSLSWDGRQLGIGPTATSTATLSDDGYQLVKVRAGDTVALHWDWICDTLTPPQVACLHDVTQRHIRIANANLTMTVADRMGEPTVENP